jgi:thiol-disulfide isomerase/thioredoxin
MSKSATTTSPNPRPRNQRGAQSNPKTAAQRAQGRRVDRPSQRGGAVDPRRHRATGGNRPPTTTRFRTRHPVLTALVPLLIVVVAIATMVVVKATGSATPGSPTPGSSHVAAGGATAANDPGTAPLAPSILAALSVPAHTLDAVGTPPSVVPPSRVTGSGTVLRAADGKPEVVYVGAEYCPYCAAERWAVAVALSRFGTFSNLTGTHSASDDVYPDTQTLSFYGSNYSSPYLDFQAVEEATNQRSGATYRSLQTPTASQSALLSAYDQAGSIPFVDIGNKYVITGASFSPQVLQGMSRTQIAAQLSDSSSAVAQQIDGAANYITAAISSMTGSKPISIASSSVIAGIAQRLGA